ncbi:MAG: pilus assembly protein TadG-related protein [Pseudomonadota bacterium]
MPRELELRNESGQMAVITALMLIPIMAITGLAVDLHLAVNSKEKVQFAMDAAVIAGARDLQVGKTDDEIRTTVRTYFGQMMNDETHGVSCDEVVVTIPADKDEVQASADCRQRTVLLAALQRDEIPIAVDASATYGINKLDIAFVFDVSGSMSDPVTGTSEEKLEVLKTAALNALDELLPPPGSALEGEVRIAIAPYDHTINVGPYFTAMTDEQPDRTWPSQTRVQTGTVCVRYRNNGSCREWDPVYQMEPNGDHTWVDVDNDIDNTCIYERDGAQAFTDAAPSAGARFGSADPHWFFSANDEQKVRGDEGTTSSNTGSFRLRNNTALNITYDDCSPSEIVPLTYDKPTLTTAINGLTANFATNGSLGFAMGWYLISPGWSYVWPVGSEPHGYTDPNVRKVIIMMTDGSFNTWRTDAGTYGNGWDRMTTLCNAAKAEGVFVYSIVFDLNNTTAETVLRNCATEPSYFHTPNSAADLVDTYADIAASISDLRLNQ